MNTTVTTTADAIDAAIARANELGLTTSAPLEDCTAVGPAIFAGHLSLGFIFIGPDVDVVTLNSATGSRSVRHCRTDPAAVAEAAAMFLAGVTL